MRRNDGQRELRSETGCRGDERVVVGMPGTLHFEVEAIRKTRRPTLRRLARPGLVPLQQRCADLAAARTGERDQPLGALVEPVLPHLRAAAVLV